MHISKQDIPVKIDAPGAVARQLPDFGLASGEIGAEYFSMAAGTDLAPLLAGLDGDVCHAAHWGYVIDGLPYLPSRLGCFRDQFGTANIRVTCEDGTYIGVLGRTNNIRDLTAWAYHPALEGEPGICVGASRDGY